MTPGQLLLKFYHTPVGRIRNSLRNGGPWAERETERQRVEMETAAATLPPLPDFPGTAPITLHLMTGRRFWYQTAFCLHSFARSAGTTVHAVIYDDGSIDTTTAQLLTRLGPGVSIRFQSELRAQLDRLLPANRFPVLRERWENYPNIRKLIDPHLGSAGWKLVIDSDLLFFRRPNFLLAWANAPDRPLHAVDCETSYGYSRNLMEELAGGPIADLVNVGLTGLKSDELDWDRLEVWTASLHAAERTSYYLEQALIAMLVAGRSCRVAPAADYVTLPRPPETERPAAVMHHYVAGSKRHYFRTCWRLAVAR